MSDNIFGQGTRGMIGRNLGFNAYGMGDMPGLNGGYDSSNFGAIPMGNTGTGQSGGAISGGGRLNPFQQYGKAFNNASTLGKFGMGLGTAGLAMGLASGLKGIFGGRQGPSREEIEQEALARSGMGLADQFGGEMGSLGMGLQSGGRSMLERGRSGYLSTMFDPSVATGQRAQLASDLSNAQRGVAGQVGLMGGPLAGARFARNASAYNPNFAAGSVQIGNNAVQRRGQGYQSMANFGQQDFNQGLGLRNQGFGIQSQGSQNLGRTLSQLSAARQAREAQKAQMIGGLFKAAGSAATGGLF